MGHEHSFDTRMAGVKPPNMARCLECGQYAYPVRVMQPLERKDDGQPRKAA